MTEADRAGVVLEWSGEIEGVLSGAELRLSMSLKNTGDHDVHVRHSSPYARVLDRNGQQVDTPGWITAVGHVVTLRPAQAQVLSCRVELRGRRGGARRAPLRAGDYLVEGVVLVSTQPDGAGQETLTTPPRPITVIASELLRGG